MLDVWVLVLLLLFGRNMGNMALPAAVLIKGSSIDGVLHLICHNHDIADTEFPQPLS